MTLDCLTWIVAIGLIIFFIEKREVIGIFAFTVGRVGVDSLLIVSWKIVFGFASYLQVLRSLLLGLG